MFRLENRQQLVTSCHMGPKVFINCAGFVKIDTSALGDSEQYIEVLDGSRIHNEAYEWARKMAVDALEYDDDEEEGNPASAVEDILRLVFHFFLVCVFLFLSIFICIYLYYVFNI